MAGLLRNSLMDMPRRLIKYDRSIRLVSSATMELVRGRTSDIGTTVDVYCCCSSGVVAITFRLDDRLDDIILRMPGVLVTKS